MIVFEKLGINFVHAPKTGGSAVVRALMELEGRLDEWHDAYNVKKQQSMLHLPWTGLHGPCKQKLPGLTAVFTREPGSLSESCFNYARYRKAWTRGAEAFVSTMEKNPRDLPMPMSFYVSYGAGTYLQNVDFVGHFESLVEDFFVMLRLADVKVPEGFKFEQVNALPYPQLFSEKQRQRAAAAFQKI